MNRRFTKDYNLPINLFDETHFTYYHKLYSDFWPEEAWQEMIKDIESCGDKDKWLESLHTKRDTIIKDLSGKTVYRDFIEGGYKKYQIPPQPMGEKNLYTSIESGNKFLSIDLRKANFQALREVGVVSGKTYSEFLDLYEAGDYLKGSKYLRQVIFGNLSPKHTISVERFLLLRVKDYLRKYNNLELISFGNDELIYKYYPIEFTEEEILEETGVEVKVQPFQIQQLPVFNYKDDLVDAWVKEDLKTGEKTLKKVSTIFYPQVWKLWKGLPLESIDLDFFCEGQVAKFLNPLILK